jgi:hypothetical protein
MSDPTIDELADAVLSAKAEVNAIYRKQTDLENEMTRATAKKRMAMEAFDRAVQAVRR